MGWIKNFEIMIETISVGLGGIVLLFLVICLIGLIPNPLIDLEEKNIVNLFGNGLLNLLFISFFILLGVIVYIIGELILRLC